MEVFTMRLSVLSLFAGTVLLAGTAAAQTDPAPVTITPTSSAVAVSSGHTGLGVGATQFLYQNPPGLSAVWDAGAWHAEGILSFEDRSGPRDRAAWGLGGRFWYHLHNSGSADFSAGGGLLFRHVGNQAPDENDLHIDVGIQTRVFIVSNVALSATAGLAVVTADHSSVALTGGLFGGFGIHYYFY
jgi:hypothetical protein